MKNATAAGCQLVASCDLAIAASSARFATPGVDIRLFCSTPMVALSRSVSSKHAMEMFRLGACRFAHLTAGSNKDNNIITDCFAACILLHVYIRRLRWFEEKFSPEKMFLMQPVG
jgi:enoyl-CoA hydratase/carnithine racemase